LEPNGDEEIQEKPTAELSDFSVRQLHLESMQSFLDTRFARRHGNKLSTYLLVQELERIGLSMSAVVDAYNRHNPALKHFNDFYFWPQTGALRTLLNIASDKYFK